jgi:hypothetical protein
LKFTPLILPASFLFFSCAHKDFNQNSSHDPVSSTEQVSNAPKIQWVVPSNSARLGFSWTNDPSLTTANLQQKILDQFAKAKKDNAVAGRTQGTEMGSGLYLAGDPIASYTYGRKMMVFPFAQKLQNKIAVFKDSRTADNWATLVRNTSVSGIYYSFGGIEFAAQNNNAIVARNEDILDLKNAFVVDLSQSFGTPWGSLAKPANLDVSDAKQVMSLYGGNITLFESVPLQGFILTAKPERPISNLGVLRGIQSSLAIPSPALKTKVFALKGNKAYPVAMDRLNFVAANPRFNTDEYRYSLYLSDVFDSLLEAMYPKLGQLPSGNSDLKLAEAMAFAIYMGLIDKSQTSSPKTQMPFKT